MADSFDFFEVNLLTEPFLKKFTHGSSQRFQIQRCEFDSDGRLVLNDKGEPDLSYGYREDRQLNEQDMYAHFSQRMIRTSWYNKEKGYKVQGVKATYGIIGLFESNICKWVCIDCDDAEALYAAQHKLLPIYEKYGIQYILEWSGLQKDRAHIWFMTHCQVDVMERFMEQVFYEAGLDRRAYEVYPCFDKRNSVIRMPGGFHIRWSQVGPIQWKGSTTNIPADIMRAFIDCKTFTQKEVQANISHVAIDKSIRPLFTNASRGFFYSSRGLKLPDESMPRHLKIMATECQAINRVLHEIQADQLIEHKGGTPHNTGLYVGHMAIYTDLKDKDGGDTGESWAHRFFAQNRSRSYKDHNWLSEKEKYRGKEQMLIPTCETWHRDFGYCQGCPFAGRTGFTSPRQFFQGKKIRKRLVEGRDVRLVHPEEIRQSTFVAVKNRVWALVNSNSRQDVLLASPQGSGKSWCVDALAVELANAGKRVMIAVPSAKLAIEHKSRIEKEGVKAFVLMSHFNTFKPEPDGTRRFNLDFNCPFDSEIQTCVQLGVSSASYKEKYCERCPVKNRCPYPEQYQNVRDVDNKVVIVQHAHFRCRETFFQILQDDDGKPFDVLFVDETFINSLLHQLKPTVAEYEILSELRGQYPWVEKMVRWLRDGGMPDGTLSVPEAQLGRIKQIMESNGMPYRLPDFIRYYNARTFHNRHTGISNFIPLPDIPVRVFTDATPPIEIMQKVLNNPHIEVFGDDEVIDYRLMNPDNKIIQVLDSSMSKSKLTEDDRLYDILEFIWDKIKSDYRGMKVLITTYLDEKEGRDGKEPRKWQSDVKQWFRQQVGWEDHESFIQFSHMAVGVNDWEDCNIQFLLAGVFMSGYQFEREIWGLKTIDNYWLRSADRPLIGNIFPGDEKDSRGLAREPEPVKKILQVGGRAGVYEFDQKEGEKYIFSYWAPQYHYARLVEQYNIARTQQSIRLRFKDQALKHVYVFGNYFLPSMLITDIVLEDDLLGYIRKADQAE